MVIHISEKVHKELKIFAAKKGMSISDIANLAIETYINEYGSKKESEELV
jgi:predicted HicB family RNase H-like nuclease